MPSYDLGITVTGHDRASGVFRPVESAISRILTIAGGIITSKLILGIADHITHLATSSIEATAQLQSMTVSLESLASRELVKASEGMLTLADVEGKAGKMAKEMIDELSKISILSPYTLEAVQNTFRLNTAFGYTFEEAKKMTDGLLKLAAGVGADNEQLNRMAYNLAQVRLQGKVMQLDVRQLAMAGVDLEDVLRNVASQLGFNIEGHKEFNELIASGKITWEQFAQGFSEYADKYFGKASEKMARTLMGLKSTFHDVFILTMPTIIGPSVEKVTGILGKLLDMFIKVRDTDILEKLGLSFSKSLGGVLDPIEDIIDGINKYIDVWLVAKGFVKDGLGLSEAQKQLKGMKTPLEIVRQGIDKIFGPGMGASITKGASFIVTTFGKVKDFFGQLLNDMMAGVGNLGEFWEQNGSDLLKIFGELADGFMDFFDLDLGDSMESTGGFFERFTQKLVDNGPKIVEMFSKAKDVILNVVLPAIKTFITTVVNEWLPKAIEFGNYIRDNWQPILEKVAVVVGVIVAALAGFSILKTIAGFVFALIGPLMALLTQIALAGSVTAFLTALGGIATTVLPFVAVAVGVVAVAFSGLIAAVAGFIVAGIVIAKNWDKVKTVLNVVWDVLKNALGPVFAELFKAVVPMRDAVGELGQAFKPLIDVLGPILIPVLKFFAAVIAGAVVGAFGTLIGVVTGTVRLITSVVGTITGIISSVATIIQGVVNVVSGVLNVIIGLVTGDGEKMKMAWQQIMSGLTQIVGGAVSLIITTIVGFLGAIISFFAGFGQGAAALWASVWNIISENTTGKMGEISTTISDGWNRILEYSTNIASQFSQIGPAIIEGIRVGIENGWGALVAWFQERIQSLITAATSILQAQSPSKVFTKIGQTIPAGLKLGIGDLRSLMNTSIINPLKSIPQRIGNMTEYNRQDTNYYAPVYQIVQKTGDNFSTMGLG